MVVIIGAGPAGLATAYYLQRYGVDFKMLEQHQVGSSWARFYDHLHLHSLKHHSALPGLAMPQGYPNFPSRQQVYDYLQSYVKHFGFSIQERTKVLKVSYNHSWKLETTQGPINAETLVVATGIFNTPFTPTIKGLETFQGQTLHSQQYKRPTDFLGKSVLVVGVGNSGAEIVVALAKAGVHTDVVVRDGVLMVPYPRSVMAASLRYWLLRKLPRALANVVLARTQQGFAEIGLPLPEEEPLERYPVVGFELAKLVRQQQLRIRPEIQKVSATEIGFADGSKDSYDTLIFATGFRPTLDFLPESLLKHPRLFMIGFHYPTTEPFLLTIKREVKDVAQKIARLPQLP